MQHQQETRNNNYKYLKMFIFFTIQTFYPDIDGFKVMTKYCQNQ